MEEEVTKEVTTAADTASTFLSTILEEMGTASTAFVSEITKWITSITGNPVALAFLGIAFATIGISLFCRILQAVRA